MNNVNEDIIRCFEMRLEKEYPCCKIEWCYDQENIRKSQEKINDAMGRAMELLDLLCIYKKDVHLYVRIHVFQGWCVFRIFAELGYPQQYINKLLAKYTEEGDSALLDILHEGQGTLIKIAYCIGV